MFRKTTLALMLLGALALAQGDFEREAADIAEDAFDDAEEAADEIADDAEDAADDLLDSAEGATDDAVAQAEEAVAAVEIPKTLEEQMEEEEMYVLLIGISACLDTLWWLLWGWFIYIETNTSDSTMWVNSDGTVKLVPVGWFWGGFADTVVGWTAIQYLWVWLFYLLISVPELIFWIMDMVGEKDGDIGNYLFDMWASYPGLYGSWVCYFFAVLFPILQLAHLAGDIFERGWTNAVVQLIMHLISWLYTGIVHVLGYPYVNRRYQRMIAKEAPAAEPTPEPVEEEIVEEEEPEEEEPLEEEVEDDESEEAF